jgi:hypothetical protein
MGNFASHLTDKRVYLRWKVWESYAKAASSLGQFHFCLCSSVGRHTCGLPTDCSAAYLRFWGTVHAVASSWIIASKSDHLLLSSNGSVRCCIKSTATHYVVLKSTCAASVMASGFFADNPRLPGSLVNGDSVGVSCVNTDLRTNTPCAKYKSRMFGKVICHVNVKYWWPKVLAKLSL